MISYISGQVLASTSDNVILLVNNIGYKVNMPLHSLITESKVELYIHTHYNQETGSQLWGFYSAEELKMFEHLLQVNGVGPKTASLMVHELGISKILQAIVNEEPKELKISGIGAKTSERIIIDMRDKVSNFNTSTTKVEKKNMPYYESVVSTLENLGYQSQTAIEMYHLANITTDLTLEQAVKKALGAGN